jgi:hypothetical protein
VSIGFALLFPKNGLPFQLHLSVKDLRQPNAITRAELHGGNALDTHGLR